MATAGRTKAQANQKTKLRRKEKKNVTTGQAHIKKMCIRDRNTRPSAWR